jgi:predicted metal-dependent peptidase
MDMTDHHRQIKGALSALILDQPFFGALALRLQLKPTDQIPTAATDGKLLLYNPAFVAGLNGAQLKGLLAHEVLHCANGHPWRRTGRNKQVWNQACDYAINSVLKEAGFALPEGALLDAAYAGKAAEWIYGQLTQPQSQQPQAGGQGQQNQPQTGGQQSQPGAPQSTGQQPSAGQGQPPQQPAPEDWGQVVDNLEPDAAAQEVDWQVATLQAAQMAKAQGKLPAGLERLIEEIKHPAVDWRATLRRFVQETAQADYSWKQPNQRYLASGLYLPQLRSEQMRPLVVGLDTSGSISQAELATFATELQAIMAECQPENITVVYCDARVQAVAEFTPQDEIQLAPKGGGGTAFAPVFDYVTEQGIAPACLVYFPRTSA